MAADSDFLRSYGRRQGRKLKASQSALIETLLPRLLITLPLSSCETSKMSAQDLMRSRALSFGHPRDDEKPLWFEIGFGGGEHLVEQARGHPHINFIGCEPYINGMAKLLSSIDQYKLTNVRLYDGDARLLLDRLPDGSIERLFVLFPDPWPKTRHHKRRIITQDSLALFYRKLKPGGLLRIATDHEDYCTWMLAQLLAFKKLVWTAGRQAHWKIPPPDWVKTRYQAKAAAEGRNPTFLDWKKPLSQ